MAQWYLIIDAHNRNYFLMQVGVVSDYDLLALDSISGKLSFIFGDYFVISSNSFSEKKRI